MNMKKRTIITLLLAIVAMAGQAKVYKTIKAPKAMASNIYRGELKAREVILADTATTIHFTMEYPQGQNFRFVNTCYLMDEDGTRYPLHAVEGIKLDSWVSVPESGSLDYGANVQEWEINGANCQDWFITPSENHGTEMNTNLLYTFKNVNSDFVMDIINGEMQDSSNVRQWESNNADCQKWKLVPFSQGGNYYYIRSLMDENYVLRCDGAENGGNLSIQTYSSKDSSMLFKFAKNLDGSYTIMTRSSKDSKILEVSGASKDYGANVQQWELNGNDCQKWIAITEDLPVTETTTVTTTATTTTATTTTTADSTDTTTSVTDDSKIVWGDSNEDGKVSISDAVAILQSLANSTKYGLTKQGSLNGDIVDNGNGVTGQDAAAIQLVDAGLIDISELPIKGSDLNR